MKTNWNDLNRQEKIECYYSSLDLSKVNKESKFNIHFKNVEEFLEDWCSICWLCVSAELYTKEEAWKMFSEYILSNDIVELNDVWDLLWWRTISDVRLEFICKRFSRDFEKRVWTCYDWPPEKIYNRYKPAFYLDI